MNTPPIVPKPPEGEPSQNLPPDERGRQEQRVDAIFQKQLLSQKQIIRLAI